MPSRALQLKIGLTDGPEIETCGVIAGIDSPYKGCACMAHRHLGKYLFLRFELHDEATRSETINLHFGSAAAKEVWQCL